MKLKNLLAKNLVNTKWGSFSEALDEYLQSFKINKIGLLKNKYIPEQSDKVNLRDLIQRKGYNLVEVDGYASTLEYFKRRGQTISTEIAWLLSNKCYKYVLKSFWLKGRVYPLLLDKEVSYYYPQLVITNVNTQTSSTEIQTLDQESDIIYYFLDGEPVPNPPIKTNLAELFLDTDEFLTLDYDENKYGTNHFLINYGFNLIEEKDVFISVNTSKALFETVNQIHRIKEVPHYRVDLPIFINSNKSIFKKQYISYDADATKTSYVESIYIQSNFELARYIQIGQSSYPVLNESITRVSVPIGLFAISGVFNIVNQSVSGLEVEYNIEENGRLNMNGDAFYNYSEVMVLDYEYKPIVYAKFPKVNFYDQMYSSLKFNFICQD